MLARLSTLLIALLAAHGARAQHADDASRAQPCASCHAKVADAFALSGHAQARRSFVFEAALTVEEPRWCVSCHASPGNERGISCASCHEGRDALALAQPQLCATCHQFGFMRRDADGRALGLSDATSPSADARNAQQNTFAEWRAWSTSTGDARTCQSCHMKDGDHSFGGVRRMASLARSLVVDVDAAAHQLRISARDAGHPLPTGDIMRFISVETASDARFDEDDTQVVARFRRDLELRTWMGESAPRLGVLRDHRIPAVGDVVVALPHRARAWRVIYHLVSEEQEERALVPADISRIEVMRGALP